jgi:hypothetical protein
MIRYSRGKLEDQLDRESIVRCADELRALENSVLWFRLQQKFQEIKDGATAVLDKPSHPQHCYAAASGGLSAMELVYMAFEEIITEGTKKRDE